METYIEDYDSYNKTIIYYYSYGNGGIGDMLKYFMYLLAICIKTKIKLKYFLNDYPVNKFIKLKYDKMYERPSSDKLVEITCIDEILKLNVNVKYIICDCNLFYKINNITDHIPFPINNVFFFTKEITDTYSIKYPYVSVHLRLGDKFIETPEKYKACPCDVRDFNENVLINYIRENVNDNILFFCDNKMYKYKIKNKFPLIKIIDHDIGHTSYKNISLEQMKNTIIEFYLICKSNKIIAASESGFSKVASYFYKRPFIRI